MQAPPPMINNIHKKPQYTPSHTIYVRNLNEKIKKEELKKSLFHAFSQFGFILEIVASKTKKMRGQAFIVFDNIMSASKALREMQNFKFYGKPMVVQYSNKKSKVIAKRDGTYVTKSKKKQDDESNTARAKRKQDDESTTENNKRQKTEHKTDEK